MFDAGIAKSEMFPIWLALMWGDVIDAVTAAKKAVGYETLLITTDNDVPTTVYESFTNKICIITAVEF